MSVSVSSSPSTLKRFLENVAMLKGLGKPEEIEKRERKKGKRKKWSEEKYKWMRRGG